MARLLVLLLGLPAAASLSLPADGRLLQSASSSSWEVLVELEASGTVADYTEEVSVRMHSGSRLFLAPLCTPSLPPFTSSYLPVSPRSVQVQHCARVRSLFNRPILRTLL